MSGCCVEAKRFNESGPFSFDYLLGEDRNFTSPADVLFIDHDIPERYIRQIISNGKSVICYVNVGAWENWRSDANDFPESVLGNDYDGWPGERWLDIRNLKVVLPIMQRRFRDAVAKGCEGIDPDNMNGWSVNTGFNISFNDQLFYNQAIAREVRRLGMLAGLKNDNEQAVALEPFSDFAVVEECAQYRECDDFDIFIQRNKPVFGIEYTEYWSEDNFKNRVCPLGRDSGMSFILKELELHNDFIVSCL
ncbi:hypothetical protein Bhyg_04500 [Pseudolycoriella hygida]|uniref:Glycoside-hydrolase family GH114 TIM-barrel domain-containing protein n=1 Tax=Pseudolycoriella hygida TaxID=35572 RepID=A0A9Q0NGN7_9DIPT|nr:hypothetical protein Bhyg_04500 [Pseudolycoriella hygida]